MRKITKIIILVLITLALARVGSVYGANSREEIGEELGSGVREGVEAVWEFFAGRNEEGFYTRIYEKIKEESEDNALGQVKKLDAVKNFDKQEIAKLIAGEWEDMEQLWEQLGSYKPESLPERPTNSEERGEWERERLLTTLREVRAEYEFEKDLAELEQELTEKVEATEIFANGTLTDTPEFIESLRYDLVRDLNIIDIIIFGEEATTPSPLGSSLFPTEDQRELEAAAGGGEVPRASTQAPFASGEAEKIEALQTHADLSQPPSFGEIKKEKSKGEPPEGFPSAFTDSQGKVCQGVDYLDLDDSFVSGTGKEVAEEEPPKTESGYIVGGAKDAVSISPSQAPGFPYKEISLLPEEEENFADLYKKALARGDIDENDQCWPKEKGDTGMYVLFCISVETGNYMVKPRKDEENCIACHIQKMNEVFEEKIFTNSIRPRKNQGLIGGSGFCKGALEPIPDFNIYLYFKPIRFVNDICSKSDPEFLGQGRMLEVRKNNLDTSYKQLGVIDKEEYEKQMMKIKEEIASWQQEYKACYAACEPFKGFHVLNSVEDFLGNIGVLKSKDDSNDNAAGVDSMNKRLTQIVTQNQNIEVREDVLNRIEEEKTRIDQKIIDRARVKPTETDLQDKQEYFKTINKEMAEMSTYFGNFKNILEVLLTDKTGELEVLATDETKSSVLNQLFNKETTGK